MSRLKIAPPPMPAAPEEAPVAAPEPVETLSPAPAPRIDARPSRLASAPPKLAQAPINLHLPSEGFVDLNFKVEPELRQRFKLEAVRRGMSNKELLEACFTVYLETFPSDEPMPTIKRPTAETLQRRREKRLEREKRMERIRARQG